PVKEIAEAAQPVAARLPVAIPALTSANEFLKDTLDLAPVGDVASGKETAQQKKILRENETAGAPEVPGGKTDPKISDQTPERSAADYEYERYNFRDALDL